MCIRMRAAIYDCCMCVMGRLISNRTPNHLRLRSRLLYSRSPRRSMWSREPMYHSHRLGQHWGSLVHLWRGRTCSTIASQWVSYAYVSPKGSNHRWNVSIAMCIGLSSVVFTAYTSSLTWTTRKMWFGYALCLYNVPVLIFLSIGSLGVVGG
jgi:hypothetical protein